MNSGEFSKRGSARRLLCLVVVPFALWHCAEPAAVPPPGKPSVGEKMDLDETQIAELEEFSRALAADVTSGEAAFMEEVFDYEHLVERVLRGIDVPDNDFAKGFIQGLKNNPGGIAASFKGQDYQFLRVLDRDGVPTLLFRIRLPEGGVNYHAYLFRYDDAGSVKLYDFYVFVSGEFVSQSMRRLAIPALAQSDNSIVHRLLGRDRVFADNMNTLQAISGHVRAQEYDEAVRLFDQLPREIQEDKSVRLIEIGALAFVEGADERHLLAIESYRDAYPDDPSLPLVVFDYHALLGEYEVAMGLVDSLDELVGGDPYLETLRIATALYGERPEEALDRGQKYAAANPDDEDSWWMLVTAGLSIGSFEVVRDALEVLSDRFGQQFTRESLSGAPDYADFLESAPAREFLEGR